MNKLTVITGASSGIGAALAKQLGSKGHHLVLAARREDELNRVANETGTNTLVVTADVTRRAYLMEPTSSFLHLAKWARKRPRSLFLRST